MSKIQLKHDANILRAGINIPADNGNPMDKKPAWFDQEKYNRVKLIFLQHSASIFLSHLYGLILIFLFTPLVEPLLYTGKSSCISAIRRRYLLTAKHVFKWYTGDIWNPEDPAHKSLLAVRKMHKNVAKAMDSPTSGMTAPDGMLFFSQAGMTATQFTFIAWMIRYSDDVGLHCDKEELECLIHFWRCIGYLLGIDDKYNICDGTYEESYALYKKLIEEEVKVYLKKPRRDGIQMSKDIVTALSKVLPLMSWSAIKKYWFEIIDFPIDFNLDFYDTLCYWYYKFFSKVLMKYKYTKNLVNYLFIKIFSAKMNIS